MSIINEVCKKCMNWQEMAVRCVHVKFRFLSLCQREEREKEAQFLAQTREIHTHRREMIAERERKAREQADLDQQLLQQRVVQDQKVLHFTWLCWSNCALARASIYSQGPSPVVPCTAVGSPAEGSL